MPQSCVNRGRKICYALVFNSTEAEWLGQKNPKSEINCTQSPSLRKRDFFFSIFSALCLRLSPPQHIMGLLPPVFFFSLEPATTLCVRHCFCASSSSYHVCHCVSSSSYHVCHCVSSSSHQVRQSALVPSVVAALIMASCCSRCYTRRSPLVHRHW